MKNLFLSLIVALFYISCSSDNSNPASNSSNVGNNSSLVENGQAMIPNKNGEAEKPYIGNGKIYLANDNNKDNITLTNPTMLEIGTLSNGEITIALPANVDSRFLKKIEWMPEGLTVEPLGVEAILYADSLRIFDDGKYIANLKYIKTDKDGTEHSVSYWYFSKDTRMNGRIKDMNGIMYKVEAKEGWNKVYIKINVNDISAYYTTDLSEVPDGLAWIISEK